MALIFISRLAHRTPLVRSENTSHVTHPVATHVELRQSSQFFTLFVLYFGSHVAPTFCYIFLARLDQLVHVFNEF